MGCYVTRTLSRYSWGDHANLRNREVRTRGKRGISVFSRLPQVVYVRKTLKLWLGCKFVDARCLSQNIDQASSLLKNMMKMSRDVTPCPWASTSWQFDISYCPYLQGKFFFFNCLSLKERALRCFETSENSRPSTHRHIRRGFNLHQQFCDALSHCTYIA